MSIFNKGITDLIVESRSQLDKLGEPRNRAERVIFKSCLDIMVVVHKLANSLETAKPESHAVIYDHAVMELARIDSFLFAVELYREVASDA